MSIYLLKIYDECDECGRLVILHQNPSEECTRSVDKSLEVVAKNWRDLRRCLKPILKEIKEERMKEKEQNVHLDGIKKLIQEIWMDRKPSSDTKIRKYDAEDTSVVNNKPRLLTNLQRFQYGQRI